MVLIDTSIWIDVFRARRPLALEGQVNFDEIVTCLPIVQEVLQGFTDERAYRIAREAMLALPMVENPLRQEIFEHAVELYRSARRQGLTVRSSVDCLVAACALRHDLEVFHRDRDYAALAQISPLRQRTW